MGWFKDKWRWYVRSYSATGDEYIKVYDQFGNKVFEEITPFDAIPTSEEIDAAIAAGLVAGSQLIDELQELGVELIDDIKDVSVDLANSALEIVQGAGLAAIEGVEVAFDYTYSRISPHRVEAVSVFTAMMVYLTTAVIVFKKIKGAN